MSPEPPALWMVQEATPLGSASSLPQSFLLKCLEQVRKIQADGAALQERLMGCLSQLHSGLLLYQGLLQALAGISPELAPTLDMLQLDVTDFATNIWQQMEDLGVAPAVQPTHGPMPTFASAFQRRAGGVLVASNLQRFLELAYRGLRYLAEP
uniref:Granulocyte colony-stimulating factor n=1 Tax=Equus asinus asinus TaxID=83772 RepID=A0A8C4KZJ1_EQUAS